MNKIKKQVGFALIEVMIAALVMVIGGLGFLKLQQMGLQYGFNNYARAQGTVLADGLVEQLRSNIGLLRSSQASGTAIQGSITKALAATAVNAPDCSSLENMDSCAKSVRAFHEHILSQQMQSIAGNSTLCYVERAAGTGNMRITYLWQDNSKEGKDANIACPADFNAHINPNNSVTIYAQL